MDYLNFTFICAILALSGLWVLALRTSIRALRVADPALYQAVVSELAGVRGSRLTKPDATGFSMLRWMRKSWRHHDIRRHRAVRRWMYVHHGAHSALIAVSGFGLTYLLLN